VAFKEKFYKRINKYSGNAVNFYIDQIVLPDGKPATREYLDHPGAVAVIPFLSADKIIMVTQYRYPVGRQTWEVPAGKLDRNERPESCVRRELEEETGFRAKKIKKLISYWPTPAFANEVLHVYAAFDLSESVKSPDEDEFIEHKIFSFKEALKLVKNGKIMDSKTIIALLYWETFAAGKL